MSPIKRNAGENPSETPEMSVDYQALDSAWYTVRMVLEKEELTLKFLDLTDEHDHVFSSADFKSLKEVEDFKDRFRPSSVQMQDGECCKVIEGMTVCASCHFNEDDIRFYDAVIERVTIKDHIFENGEEVCTCTFLVLWQHGAMAGFTSSIRTENICLLQPGNVESHSTLSSFLKMSRKKFDVALRGSVIISEDDDLNVLASGEYKLKPPQRRIQACHVQETKDSVNASPTFEGRKHKPKEELEHDFDFGGGSVPIKSLGETRNYHILIENMEKDLTPLAIVNFINKHTSITSQAYVFPSLASESYTRGVIITDSQQKLQKLTEFLHNPAHVIMSSRGRPWVIAEKMLSHGKYEAVFGCSQLVGESSRLCREEVAGEIQVVTKGTKDFNKGKQLIELYNEFSEHLQGLHKRLAMDVEKILQ